MKVAPNGDSSLADALAVVTGLVGTISILVLTLIGLAIAVQFWRAAKRIDDLEQIVNTDRARIYGLSNLSKMLLDSTTSIVSILDLERRQITDIIVELNKPTKSRRKFNTDAFEKRIEPNINELMRVSWYFKVLTMDKSDASALDGLISHYPDHKTLKFLSSSSELFSGDLKQKIEVCIECLSEDIYIRRIR